MSKNCPALFEHLGLCSVQVQGEGSNANRRVDVCVKHSLGRALTHLLSLISIHRGRGGFSGNQGNIINLLLCFIMRLGTVESLLKMIY